jgi:hypothetical protein
MRTAVAALAATSLVLALAAPAGIDEGPRPLGTARESGPDGVLVIAALSPERVLVADPGTGRRRERELPGGTLCHGPLLAIGDRVVYVGSRGGRAVALSAPLGRLGRARSLGPAQLIVPSADTGRLWLGRWTDADHIAGRLMLREVDAGGHVTATAGRRLPRWAWLTAATTGGFLFADDSGLVRRTSRLDRPRVLVRGGWLVAAAADRLASGDYAALAWSPSGRWLYLGGRGDRVLASRGGTERAVRLPIRTRGTVMSIASSANTPGSADR